MLIVKPWMCFIKFPKNMLTHINLNLFSMHSIICDEYMSPSPSRVTTKTLISMFYMHPPTTFKGDLYGKKGFILFLIPLRASLGTSIISMKLMNTKAPTFLLKHQWKSFITTQIINITYTFLVWEIESLRPIIEKEKL